MKGALLRQHHTFNFSNRFLKLWRAFLANLTLTRAATRSKLIYLTSVVSMQFMLYKNQCDGSARNWYRRCQMSAVLCHHVASEAKESTWYEHKRAQQQNDPIDGSIQRILCYKGKRERKLTVLGISPISDITATSISVSFAVKVKVVMFANVDSALKSASVYLRSSTITITIAAHEIFKSWVKKEKLTLCEMR